jgi:hypothetical protein
MKAQRVTPEGRKVFASTTPGYKRQRVGQAAHSVTKLGVAAAGASAGAPGAGGAMHFALGPK